MIKSNKNVTKLLTSVIITVILLLAGSCQNWMSSDDFMSKIEGEVHDANAKELTVFVRYAHDKMGKTEPTGNTKMKVDVTSKLSAVTADDYGFKKWAAFSTADFPKDKNHSDLMYISEESYNENFKEKELPESEVVFTKPTEPITEVNILKNRNDIFIIPIVAPRPAYVQSVPAGGDYNVVKNTSIRILFSKAIKKSTIYDEEGKLNYSISSSAATLVDDDQEIVANDITDYFDWKLSDSGKMLTLSLKKDADTNEIIHYLDNRQRITITLFEGLCDTDGFAMNGNYTFSFQTGTSTDSLAPMIEVIFGGSGDKCNVFVSYHNVDDNGDATINGVATDAAKKAPTNIDSAEYTDALVAQRIYDKLNLFVKATDIIASGNADINPAKDLNEDNVNAIGIAASLWVDKDGKAVTLDETNTIAKKNYVYIPGTIDKDSQMQGVFSEIVPLDKDGNKYTGGTIYTYDVSSLPDGLIKIDVWGIDMTGNSGGPADAGSPYYTKHDNGYKSIFVVKDTTPPDSATEAKKIKSNSEKAPYFWYNNTTLTSMQLYDLDANQIADAGHAKLRSLAKNLQWNFVVGKVEQAPAANDEHWKYIHDSDSGVSLKYELKDAKAPSADGPVDITMFIRDDIGNVSKPVLLNSIMYDNTQPTVKLKAGKGDFVKADGQDDLHVSEPIVITQILKVEIGEANENNAGSGIRRMEIHVKNKENGQEVAVPLDATNFKVKYAPASITNPTPSAEGVRDIAIAADDTATTANLKVFKVTDADKITSGTLFVYGITLGNADGQYEVYVDLYDSALNKTPATAKTVMSRDTTDPIITKVQVMDAKARKVYGANEETWWLPYDRFEDANNLSKVTLVVTANESGSGLENLKLAENAEFTANTEIYINNTKLTKGVDYTLDVANRTIKLTDWYTPKLINANGGSQTIKIENVKLNNINVPAGASQGQGNKIKLTVDDFVGKSKSENTITYDNTEIKGTLVYGDSVAPTIATLTVEDSAKNTTTNPESKAYNKDKFTDSQTVILYLTLGDTEAGNKGSGVDKVILSDNAVFTGTTTEIFVVNGSTETKLTPSTDYEIASDNKSVSFKKVFTETNKLKFTNVNIISATNGPQIIKADVQDFAGIRSVVSKPTENTIVYDNVKPAVSLIKWIADDLTITAGSAKDKTISNQNLEVDFDEITAGVKVIKMDIVQEGISSTPYASPFGDTNFQLLDANGTPLAKGTDYTIDGQYIILTNPRLTGTLNFRGVTLNNATGDSLQGLYSINVALLDAAENRIDTDSYTNSQNHDPSIVIDNVAPVISKKLEIKNLHETTELTTGTSAWDGKWLDKSYIGGNGTGKAPDAIPVYITLKEKSSGVKVIKFAESAVLSADTTTLFTVDANGTPTAITPRDERYEVHPESKEIIIKSKTDAKNTFSKSDGSEFTILVDNVGFANADSATGASNNTISVTISDVAKNVSASETTVEGRILSDSIAPAAPQNLKLKDRRFSAATKTVIASEGYTNEDIVDMTFNLSDSEKFGSGYHKFVLTGASFIGGDSADKTTMTVKVGDTAISNAEFALSDDGKTLTLKKTGQADNVYAVIRQAVSVELKNVKLDNGTTDGSKTVTLTAYDLTGWNSSAASTSIILDTQIPALEKGVFTANYTNSNVDYYKPNINVYPHADGESGKGKVINYGTESNPLNVYTFYTATTYRTGYYKYNGEVSASSSSLSKNFVHGAVLGIRGKDNIRLGGWTRAYTFLYYYKYSDSDTPFSKTESDILGSTNPTLDINNKGNNNNQPNGDNSATATTLWFGFDEGKYSAVIVDEAGNTSKPFHFQVVRDVEKPLKEWGSGNNADNLNNRVLLQMPDDSAQAYTKKAPDASSSFAEYSARWMNSTSIRTKQYITKKTKNKYMIQLNLGGTYTSSTPIKKIDGTTASSTTRYSELDVTEARSPIEMYAISISYGSYPTGSNSTYKYAPVVPYGTEFPSGEIHDKSSESPSLPLGRDYFGYSPGHDTSYWRFRDEQTNHWHLYSNGITYKDTYTNISNFEIVSYIDSKDNLIIEIPNNTSVPPISVFLKDGCGNMQYLVCGLYKDSDNNEVAVSFVLDDKLGNATTSETSDGRYAVTTPVIVQNPHLTVKAESDETDDVHAWNGITFKWNKQSANANKTGNDGIYEEFGFMRDKIKYATYYNPRLYTDENHYIKEYGTSAADKKKWTKLALTLQFNSGNEEPVLFTSGADTPVTNTDSADSNDAYDYTCRAKLYCTTSTAVPTYTTIKNAPLESSNPANVSSFATDWVGVKSVSGQITICLDYPQPDYDTLGWNVNNSTTHETVPFYMWYVFEDRVGNYEIGKVVNQKVTGSSLQSAPSATGTVFDKWLYDGKAPVVTVVNTTKTPDEITNTQSDVSALISENNGFVPYLDTSTNTTYKDKTIWLNTTVQSLRKSGLGRSPSGWGVTNLPEDGTSTLTNSNYLPFANLTVSKEITGIRAFCWSTNSTAPAYTSIVGNGNPMGNKYDPTDYPYGAWYAGYGLEATGCGDDGYGTKVDIGFNYTYTDSDSNRNAVNSYLPNTTSGKTYYGRYSGTKINAIIPPNLVNDNPNTPLYLHVMDWTGNVKSYRMGSTSSGLKFKSDTTYPTRHYTETGTKDIIRSVDNEWLVRSNGTYIYIHIAGLGAGSSDPDTGKKTMQIRLPDEYFTDSGSGYKGLSLSSLNIGSVKRDTTGPYLEVSYNTYSNWSTNPNSPTQPAAYYYDNVGNQASYTLQCIYDTDAPAISTVSLMPESGTTLADTASGAFTSTKPYTHPTSSGPHSDVSSWASGELQEVYVKTTNSSKVKFKITLAEDPGDFGEAKVNKWNGTLWETVSSTKDSTTWDTTTTTFEMPGYSLDCASTGTYYQIVVTDVSSNASYQYFKLIKDNEAPTFATTTPKPVVTLRKGSIGKITNDGTDNYYYAADASYPLKLSFGIVDAGSGSVTALKKFKYSFDGSTWLPANGYISNPDNFEIDISSGNIETFYFMDILGNKQTTALTPELSYTYNASGTSTTVSIPKLTAYTATPDRPAITTKVVGPNLNDPNSTKYNIVEQVETKGKGLKDDYRTYNKENWTHLYTEKFENVDNTIRIKEQKGYERTKVRITFPQPANSNMIKGYIKSDTALNIHSYDENQIGKYSLADNFTYKFTDDLNVNHAEDDAFTRYYYAVDIVGNISPALILTYSYENPHIPKDVALIDPLHSSTDKTNNNYIAAAVKSQMETDGLDFAKIIKVTAPEKPDADKKYVKYFSKGFMVVRCTLYQKAGADYSETPNKIELWDKWGDAENERGLRAESGPADDLTLFKVYPSDEKDGNRYYCWIAFKPGKLTTTAGATEDDPPTYSFEPYVVDNNLEFNGSNFHGFIKGATCQSGFIPLDPESTNAQNKVGWILDKEAPVIEGNAYLTNENHLIGYTASQSLSKAADNTVGLGYVSVTYQRGTTISIPVANLKDEMSGLAKYKFVVSGQNVDDVNWETATPSNDMYTFTLPPVETIHKNISLYLQDNFGNVSSTPYILAHPEEGAYIWWIVNDILTKEGAVTTWGDAPEWTADAENYTFTVMPPEGSIIKKVTIKVDGQEKNSENKNWGTYKFNGYPEDSQSPELNGSEGWLVVNDGDKKGLDITVKKITKDWANHKIEISINDDTNLTKTYNNFVTAKTFSAADVDISDADENKVVTLSSPTGAPLANYITGVSAKIKGTSTNINTELSEDKTKVTLKNVPGKLWASQTIELTVNASNNVTKSADVLTIGAIAAGDITVGTATWDGTNSRYEIPVTYSNGASPSAITSVTSTLGNVAFAKKSDGTTDDTAKILLTGIPKKLWASQDVGITISDGGTHTVQNAAVLNIQAYAATDFTVTGDATFSNGEYTITMADGSDLPSIEAGDFSAGEGVSVAWASPKVTLTVTQGWTAQTLTLKLKELELKTITVEAKTLGKSDITITVIQPTEWAENTGYVKFTVNLPHESISITEITSGAGTPNKEDGTTYGISATIPKDVTISVTTNKGGPFEYRLYPEIGSGESRFFGRLISGKGKQEVYTFGDSPKTAGALQSHVVELPKFIQKFWQNDETAADEVTSTVTKEAKKAEKKSSKKASKKAATQAAKSVHEIAQTAAVTELPVEALEEPKADDQLAMILPKTANTEEAEVIEPQASVSTGSVDVSVTEAESAGHSNGVLWIILVVFCASIAGLVLCLKKKRA